jgi:hypothetical protein
MKCPACDSTRIYPSRLRNVFERLRQTMTDKQPYRCHACGWRKWREVRVHDESTDVHPEELRTGRVPQPVSARDLDQLDKQPPRS